MARRAAELIDDGDSILLDASSTVYYLSLAIQKRQRLRVVTNGLDSARLLAKNPTNSVILIGGVLNQDGSSVTGLFSEQTVRELHTQKAFVSCSGFSPERGMTEVHLEEAQLKRLAIESAAQVIALIDSSKFGRLALVPFARSEQINRIFTDSGLDPRWIELLQATCTPFSVCDEEGAVEYAPCTQENRRYRIGFANLGESMPFSIDVRRGLEQAAQGAGNIDLVLADNQLDKEVGLAVAERFASQNLDLVIEYQIDEQIGNQIMDIFRQTGIPVIAVDIPIVGATFFGVNNYHAGHMAGLALGEWIKANWGGVIDWLVILEEPRAGSLVAARIQGQLDKLQSVIGEIPPDKRITLDSGNTCEISEAEMTAALKLIPDAHRIVVVCFNDDAAYGALLAARKYAREQDVIIVGQGADRRVREEMSKPGCRIIGSTAYFPEQYGEMLIPLALKILRGEPVPPAVYIDHVFIPAAQG
jgi:DeoR/GlpR family transcriptional regulator of sugar metabolism